MSNRYEVRRLTFDGAHTKIETLSTHAEIGEAARECNEQRLAHPNVAPFNFYIFDTLTEKE